MTRRTPRTSRRKPHTPDSQIRAALRLLTLRCRERAQALRDAGYRCAVCGTKHSRAKGREATVEAHHQRRPDWQRVFSVIREELLPPASGWTPLCKRCHDNEHEEGTR